MSDSEQTILLKEIVKWLRFSGMKQVREALSSSLNDDSKKLSYHFSDGVKTTRDIAKISGMGKDAVNKLWKDCYLLGLGEQMTASGGSRFKKSFELKDFGISIPEIKQETSKPQNNESVTEDMSNE